MRGLACSFGFFAFLVVQAGVSPLNTLVVVNGQSWASLTVANEYRELRHIPENHFVVLNGITNNEVTNVQAFRDEILGPVLAAIKERGLKEEIDCVAYCPDIPYAAQTNIDMAGRQFPQVITPVASGNGLTYLHELVMAKNADYLRLDINRYARKLLPLPSGTALSSAEQNEYARGMALYDAKQYQQASEIIGKLLQVKRSDSSIAYNQACCLALAGKPDVAMAALRMAAAAGWRNHGQITSDPDLVTLRERPDFKALIQQIKDAPIEVQAPLGFAAGIAWNERGEPVANGPKYLLSSYLGVTCGRGNSVAEVIASLRRSVAAEGTAPSGTIYYPKNGDVRSTTREWGFAAAVAALGKAGVKGVVEDGLLPNKHDDVAGAMIGTAQFDWATSGSRLLPGSIAEHLTSLGGIISERGGQTPCTDLIRAGASGSSGTVTEPYALQEKFPTPFMHVQYVQGYTLVESFYLSLSGPYQLLIIGDPLCRPWAKKNPLTLTGLANGGVVKGAIKFTVAGTGDKYEVFADGQLMNSANTPELSLDTTGLEDGNHTISVVCISGESAAFKDTISINVVVNNENLKVPVMTSEAVADGFKVRATVSGADSVEILHLGRVVGKGEATVTAAQVGYGKVTLTPVAIYGNQKVAGQPIQVQIDPAKPLMGTAPGPGTTPGLRLSVAGKGSMFVADTMPWDWLSKIATGPGQQFVLTGTYEAKTTELYQLLMTTNTNATLNIDGVDVIKATDTRLHLNSVHLAKGFHQVSVKGVAPAGAQLDVRIGSAGCFKFAAPAFTAR